MSTEKEISASKKEVLHYLLSVVRGGLWGEVYKLVIVLSPSEEEDLERTLRELEAIAKSVGQTIPKMRSQGQNRGLTPLNLKQLFDLTEGIKAKVEDKMVIELLEEKLINLFSPRAYEILNALNWETPNLEAPEIYTPQEVVEAVGTARLKTIGALSAKLEVIQSGSVPLLLGVISPIPLLALAYILENWVEFESKLSEIIIATPVMVLFFLSIFYSGLAMLNIGMKVIGTNTAVNALMRDTDNESGQVAKSELGRIAYEKGDFDRNAVEDLLPAFEVHEAIIQANRLCRELVAKGMKNLDSNTINALLEQAIKLRKLTGIVHKYPRVLPKQEYLSDNLKVTGLDDCLNRLAEQRARLRVETEIEQKVDLVRQRPRFKKLQ